MRLRSAELIAPTAGRETAEDGTEDEEADEAPLVPPSSSAGEATHVRKVELGTAARGAAKGGAA